MRKRKIKINMNTWFTFFLYLNIEQEEEKKCHFELTWISIFFFSQYFRGKKYFEKENEHEKKSMIIQVYQSEAVFLLILLADSNYQSIVIIHGKTKNKTSTAAICSVQLYTSVNRQMIWFLSISFGLVLCSFSV